MLVQLSKTSGDKMLGIILFIGQAVVPVKSDEIYISIVTNSLWKMFSSS
jgi:hypothetical protein